MKASVGTSAWAAHGGALSLGDRARLLGQALVTQLASMPPRMRRSLGWNDARLARINAAAIRLPDSAFITRATAHVQALSPPWLVQHCLRTYVWGAALAQADRTAFDAELLCAASLLHDLGLTDAHNGRDATCACFAVEGSRAARQFATQEAWDDERADRMAEAIALHMNARVALAAGAEAHLLHAGASLDVVGARIDQLQSDSVAEVIARYPRGDFKRQLADCMKQQARQRPHSRAAFLVSLGFIGMIRRAPIEDAP